MYDIVCIKYYDKQLNNNIDFLQSSCILPVDDLRGKGESSKIKNEDVPSLRTDVEVAVDLREAALGYRLAPGGRKSHMIVQGLA